MAKITDSIASVFDDKDKFFSLLWLLALAVVAVVVIILTIHYRNYEIEMAKVTPPTSMPEVMIIEGIKYKREP